MFLPALSPTTLSLSLCSLSHQLKNSSFLQVHHRDHCFCPANQANMDRASVQFGRSGWGAVKGCFYGLIMPYRSHLLLGRRAVTNLYCALLRASVMSDSSRPPTDCSPPGTSVRRNSLGKNIGVGCHALF